MLSLPSRAAWVKTGRRPPAKPVCSGLDAGSTVLRQWLSGALTNRQVIRIAMRVTRFERWGVRPITQARFRALNQAAEQAVEQADILRGEMTSCLSLAADMLELKAGLETPSDLIAHLQSLESSRQEALAAQSAAVEVASRTAARNNALAANLEQATRTIEHLRRVEAAHVKAAELAAETSAEVTRLQGWNRDIQVTASCCAAARATPSSAPTPTA